MSLPLSHENFLNSFIVRKYSLSLEVRYALQTRDFCHQASSSSIESQASELVVTWGRDKENLVKKVKV